MKNQSYLNPEDEFDDDGTPYSSISDRDSLEDLSLGGRAASLNAGNEEDSPENFSLPGSPGAPLPSNPVRDMIRQRTGLAGASLPGAGAPSPSPMSVAPAQDYSNDPLMQQYEGKQKDLDKFRQNQLDSDRILAFGQAISQAAQGVNAPTPNNEVYRTIAAQGSGALKSKEEDMDRRQRIVNAIEQRKSREAVSANNLAARQDANRSRADTLAALGADRSAAKDTARQDKLDKNQKDAYFQTSQLLETARGNPAVAQAEKDIYAADKAKSLANLYGDPNKLSPQMSQLLASEVAKIASGGSPSIHELEGLTPTTLQSGLAGITQKLTNDPTPANAGAFIKQYQDYANALTRDAQKTISDRYGRILESRKPYLGDEGYGNLKAQYLDRFKQPESGGGSAPISSGKPGQLIKAKGKLWRIGPDGDSLEAVM